MYKITIAVALMFLLIGCATTANYQQKLNKWQGARAQDLVSEWGHPDSSIKLANGDSVYMYFRQQLYTTPSYPMPSFTPLGTPVYSGGMPTNYAGSASGQTMNLYCRTWFEINPQNIIVSSRFEGNNCVAIKH